MCDTRGLFFNDREDQCGEKPLKSWHSSSVLLSHLLDVNSISGKHVHKLRGLSALLITMAEAEISIVSPCEHFGWVCKKYEKHNTTLSLWHSTLSSADLW